MGDQFRGHRLCEFRIDNRHVRRDIEVRQRIFDARLIVGDDGERRHLGRRAGGRGNGAEFRLRAERGEVKGNAQLFKRDVRIFVERPHRLRRVDGRTAAHGDDPVGLERGHRRSALHDRFDRGIGFDVFKELNFHTRFFQV